MIIMETFQCLSPLLEEKKFRESCQNQYNIPEEKGYKCGEAYFSSKGAINIQCTLCGSYFDYGNENYLKHVINDHFSSFLLRKECHEYDFSVKEDFLGEKKVNQSTANLEDNCVSSNNLRKNCSRETEKLKGISLLENGKVLRNFAKVDLSNVSLENNYVAITSLNRKTCSKGPEKLKEKSRVKTRGYGKKCTKVEKLISEKHKCLNCFEEFDNRNDLVTHQKGHNDLKLDDGLICEQCGRKFARKNTLESHYEIAHNPNRKLFPCNECEKSFTTSESLVAHNRHYHTKELPYICHVENCNKRYASQKGLKYHQAKHSNTTFSCSECNKQYSHKNKLQIHFKRHHSVGKTFHCGQCDKSFYGSYFLKKHMVCHTNERPFLCDQCPANFPRQKALVAHKKGIHSGMKDEICKLCGQTFNLYEGLYQHMRIRHGIKYYRAMTLQDMQNKEKKILEA